MTNRLKKSVILGLAVAVLGGLVLALALKLARQTASPEPKFISDLDERPPQVHIPNCIDGWSDTIYFKIGARKLKWFWPVKAQLDREGNWVDIARRFSTGSEAIRFCTTKSRYVGQSMPLKWSK